MIQKNQVVEETTLLKEIWWNSTKEQEVIKKFEKEDGQSQKENGIIFVDRRIYIPNNHRIRERILQENYEPADIGHLGQQCMMELVKRNYWWPEIKNDVKKYI